MSCVNPRFWKERKKTFDFSFNNSFSFSSMLSKRPLTLEIRCNCWHISASSPLKVPSKFAVCHLFKKFLFCWFCNIFHLFWFGELFYLTRLGIANQLQFSLKKPKKAKNWHFDEKLQFEALGGVFGKKWRKLTPFKIEK